MRSFCRRNSKGRLLHEDEPLIHRECEAALPRLLEASACLGKLESQAFWLGFGLDSAVHRNTNGYRDRALPSWDSMSAQTELVVPDEDDADEPLDTEVDWEHQPWEDNQRFRDRRMLELVFSGFPAGRISEQEEVSVQTVRDVTQEERQFLKGFRDLWIRLMGSYCSADTISVIFGRTITAQHVRRIQGNRVSEEELGVLAALKVMFPVPGTAEEYQLIACMLRAVHCDEWAHQGTRDDANHQLILSQVEASYEHFASREPPL
jgi:hypothetical protein